MLNKESSKRKNWNSATAARDDETTCFAYYTSAALAFFLSSRVLFMSLFPFQNTHMCTYTITHVCGNRLLRGNLLLISSSLTLTHTYTPGGSSAGLGSSWDGPWALYLSLCFFGVHVWLHVKWPVETHSLLFSTLHHPSLSLCCPPFPVCRPPPSHLRSPLFLHLLHPSSSQLCPPRHHPHPLSLSPSILLSAGRRWVMPLAGRLKLSLPLSLNISSLHFSIAVFLSPFPSFSHISLPCITICFSASFCFVLLLHYKAHASFISQYLSRVSVSLSLSLKVRLPSLFLSVPLSNQMCRKASIRSRSHVPFSLMSRTPTLSFYSLLFFI